MFIYLNPPRMFWKIEESNIGLSRSNPFMEITEEDINDLTPSQKRTLELSLAGKVVSKISEEFLKGLKADPENMDIDYILSKDPTEIHKKYIGQMLVAGDEAGVLTIMNGEQKRDKPRQRVIEICKYALNAIRTKEDQFYKAIKEEELVIDESGRIIDEFDITDEEAVQITPKRSHRTRAGMLLKKDTNK